MQKAGFLTTGLIFSRYIRWADVLGFKILNFNIFLIFRQNDYFLGGMEIFLDIFGWGLFLNWKFFIGYF